MVTTPDKSKFPTSKAKLPITIIINRCLIEGESRNITANGIFTHCREHLHENETYRMIIGLPKKRYLSVKGKLIWSNLNGIDPNGTFSDMGFSFMKLYGEDRHLLNKAVSNAFA